LNPATFCALPTCIAAAKYALSNNYKELADLGALRSHPILDIRKAPPQTHAPPPLPAVKPGRIRTAHLHLVKLLRTAASKANWNCEPSEENME
jgi:hypothetical protein